MTVPRFLLVSLNIDAILGEVTISDRRQKLNEMTMGNHLGDAYATTLTRIKAQKGSRSRLGMEALMWVLSSERPLHTTELCHALGVKIGSTDLDVENVPTIRTLLACSLGLITVEECSSTVRLVHFSLQEYLSDNLSLFQSPHSVMAEVCLTYLGFRCLQELSPLSSTLSALPFARYASGYWGTHMRKGGVGSLAPLALKHLLEFEQHISSQLLFLRYYEDQSSWEDFCERRDLKGPTGLHGAAFFGIVEIVATLLAMKEWDINATDARGRTVLAWAAVGGHSDVVAMILQRKDTEADTAGTEYGMTPLWLAAKYGHEGVVKLLLERGDVNPNTTDTEYGWAPLSLAAERGHKGVVKLLLERGDVNPNTTDTKFGRTPLSWAVQSGNEGVVKLLLERGDVNPNTTDTEYGWAPLLWAVQSGNEEVVKLLLEREDVNPNTTDTEYGWAPLLWAVQSGNEEVVKSLLERGDVNPNTTDTEYGWAPLLWAVQSGNEEVVKLLLERGDVNPNTTDTKFGRTPLAWAAESGHAEVVKLLLERDDVDPDIPDLNGEIALQLAASHGNSRVVELLSAPKPSLAVPVDIDKVPERPSPDPSHLLQLPPQSTPPVSPSPPQLLPPSTRPLLGKVISSFMIVSSLVFLFYFLAFTSPSFSLSTIFSPTFHR